MILDWKHIGLFGGAILLAGVGLHYYEASVRADAVSTAVQQAQGTLQKQLAQQNDAIEKRMADSEAKHKQDTQDLQKQFAGSLAQIVALIQQRANLPVPLQVVTPPATASNPNPQPTIVVPYEDLPQAKIYLQACEQCSLDRTKLQADLSDRQKQADLAQQQIDSLKLQRDAAIKAEKGGSWLRRTVKALKYIAIGAGAGAVAVCGSGHCR